MAPGACAKVFEDFYGHAARWLPSAQSLAPNHAVVTPAFFQAAAGGAADAEGNAADAQAWIDEWKGDGPAPTSAPVEDTPEASPKP